MLYTPLSEDIAYNSADNSEQRLQKMPRNVELALFRNPSGTTHFALFMPEIGSNNIGKLIHITGDPHSGFHLGFRRGFDIDAEAKLRDVHHIVIAEVEERLIRDVKGQGDDTTAHDRFEMAALDIYVPGRNHDQKNEVCLVPTDYKSEKRMAFERDGLSHLSKEISALDH